MNVNAPYDWSDGRGWDSPRPFRDRHDRRDGWGRHHRHDRPSPPVVRDQFGRPLGYLVPSPYGPMIIERPGRYRQPPVFGRGWGPPRGW